MSKLLMVVFCALTLFGSLGVCALIYPLATLTAEEAKQATTPQDMEYFDVVDLGEDYGVLPVVELLGYYLDNPPEPQTATAAAPRKLQFGGC